MAHSGSCLCGAVKYSITSSVSETGACHCGMCRKWSGGVYLGVQVAATDMQVNGTEQVSVYTSSPWAERAFCKICGSSLWYRVIAHGPHHGQYHVGLGGFDATDGIKLSGEIYYDRKPDGYDFAQDTHKMTEAEVMAMFAPPD